MSDIHKRKLFFQTLNFQRLN